VKKKIQDPSMLMQTEKRNPVRFKLKEVFKTARKSQPKPYEPKKESESGYEHLSERKISWKKNSPK